MSGVDRIPPQSLEAEAAVLGSMMLDRDMIDVVSARVQPADFYAAIHETIATHILRLHAEGKPADKLAVGESLRAAGKLEHVGGLAYLSGLMDVVPTAASADYYAALVAEKARLRRVITAAYRIVDLGFGGEHDVDATIADADRTLREAIEAGSRPSGGMSMPDATRRAYLELEAATMGETAKRAISTPWPGMNLRIGGFFPEEMIVIASAPAMGKTALTITLADWIAAKHGPVAFFTLEMSPDALARRFLALHSELTARSQRMGSVREDQWERVSDAMGVLSQRAIRLYGRADGSIEGMRRELSALQREVGPVRAVFVDHVGFVPDADPRNVRTTEHERLDRTYRRLLDVAAEFRTTLFVVQHVSRAGMSGRPTMSQIRGGGNAEGHAHAILFPFRENAMSEHREEREQGELIIAKSRDGEVGVVPMRFLGHRHLWLEADIDTPLWFNA